MPTESKAQFRFMKGVESGSIKAPSGLSRREAKEFTQGQKPGNLPEKKPKKGGTRGKND